MERLRRKRAELEEEEEQEKREQHSSKRNMARRLAGLPETEQDESPSRKSDTEEVRLTREKIHEVQEVLETGTEKNPEEEEENTGRRRSEGGGEQRILFFNDGREEV